MARQNAKGGTRPRRHSQSSRPRHQARTRSLARSRNRRPARFRRRRIRGIAHARETLQANALRAMQAEKEAIERGVNLIGFSRSETGMGESCRLAAKAIETTGLPFGIMHVGLDNLVNTDLSWAHKELAEPRFKTNLFHINAPEMPLILERFGEALMEGRNNIGYWAWELPEFPDEYLHGFRRLDEIWVPSKFVRDSIAAKSNIPVIVIPHGIYIEELPEHLNRQWFGLPDDRFLFLCMYDSYSIKARKNPQAVIEAFRKLTAANDVRAELVVKINHPTEEETAALREQLGGLPNVRIIDRVLDRNEARALIRASDCFVSLHRSEGFGLPLAEAMYMGKPVIGTNWSGNTDFMNPSNAGTVNFRLVKVGQDFGPYKAHQLWAEPDIEHAAFLMRMMVRDGNWRQHIAASGQAAIRTHFSPQVTGNAIRDRLALRRTLLQQ